jgi:hypothetical protein
LSSFSFINPWHPSGANPQISLSFNDFYGFNKSIAFSMSYGGWYMDTFEARHCNFSRGTFRFGTSNSTNAFLNCLFEHSDMEADEDAGGIVRNCLFDNGLLFLFTYGTNPWYFHDNIFDRTTIVPLVDVTNSHNAYIGGAERFTPTNANDVIMTNLAYLSGPLGDYYLSTSQTNLIDRGSTTASTVGLYHFTTTTNQVKDASSTVDIGLHYVALDANGQPVDSDGDGVPDYVEDGNGNGLLDANLGETDWEIYTSLWSTNSPGLKVFTPLK